MIVTVVLLALIVVMGVATWFPDRLARKSDEPPTGAWRVLRGLMFPALFALMLGVYLTVYIGSRAVDNVDDFTTSVSDQLYNLEIFLIPLLVLAGSDFGDWGNLFVDKAVKRMHAIVPSWVFALVAVVLAGAVAAGGVRDSLDPTVGAGDLTEELVLASIVGVVVLLLLLLARPRDSWPSQAPFLIVAAVAIVDSTVSFIAEAKIGDADPSSIRSSMRCRTRCG